MHSTRKAARRPSRHRLATRPASLALAAALALAVPAAGATTLVQAWQAAQQHDPEFAAAAAAHQAGQARRDQASALWRPSVVLSAGAGRMSSDTSMSGARFSAPGFGQSTGVAFDTSVTNGSSGRYTLSVKQPLLSRERLAQGRQLSYAADMAEVQWQDARQALMLRVAERYFDVLVASETLRLLRQQQTAVAHALAEARDRFELGDVPVTDREEAQARADGIEAQVMAADTTLQLRQVAFADLTGGDPASLDILDATPAVARGLGPLERWLGLAALHNPSLLVQQKQQQVAREEAARHSASAAPTLDLVAQMGRDRLHGSGDFGSAENTSSNKMIGLQLTIPLYTGGYRSAKHEEALRLADQASAEGQHLRQQVALQTRAAWLGLSAGAAHVAALEQARKSALARLDATRLGREVGDRTTLELLNAENDATAAELALLQARATLALDRLRLAALAGELDETTLQGVSQSMHAPAR